MTARFPEERLAVFTLTERPDLRAQLFSAEIQSGLPEFMRHDRTAALYYSDGNLDRYLDFAFAGVDRALPTRWPAVRFMGAHECPGWRSRRKTRAHQHGHRRHLGRMVGLDRHALRHERSDRDPRRAVAGTRLARTEPRRLHRAQFMGA